MTNPALFDSNFQLQNKSSILQFCKLFQSVCNFQSMSSKNEAFSYLDHRLQTHLFPKLEKFLFSIADYEEPPTYKPPSERDLSESLSNILDVIADNYDNLKKYLISLDQEPYKTSSTIGWIFASAVSSVFPQSFDSDFSKYEETANTTGENNEADQQAAEELEQVDAIDYNPEEAPPLDPQVGDIYNNPGYIPGGGDDLLPPINADLPPLNPDLPPLNNSDGNEDSHKDEEEEQNEKPKKKGKKGRRGKRAAKTVDLEPPPSDFTPSKKVGKKGHNRKAARTLEGSAPKADLSLLDPIPAKKTGKKGTGKKKGRSKTAEGVAPPSSLDLLPTPKKSGKKKLNRNKRSRSVDGILPIEDLLADTPKTKKKARGGKKGRSNSIDNAASPAPKATARKNPKTRVRSYSVDGIEPLENLLAPTPKKTKGKGKGKRGASKTIDGIAPSSSTNNLASVRKATKSSDLPSTPLQVKRSQSVENLTRSKRGNAKGSKKLIEGIDAIKNNVQDLINQPGKSGSKSKGKKKTTTKTVDGDVPSTPRGTKKKGKKASSGQVPSQQSTPATPKGKRKAKGKKK